MRRTLLTLSLSGLLLTTWLAPQALAQDAKSARGTVSALAGDSLTIKAGDQTLTFAVDGKTVLEAEGAGTAARKAAASATAGPKLADFLKTGEAVEVSYREGGGAMRAERVRKVGSVGRAGGTTGSGQTESSTGTVDAVTATSLTISGATGGGGKFKQAFVIDSNTRIVGQGAGTLDAAKGGKMTATDYLKPGDRVTVTYRAMGTALHATEVRVSDRPK
jgi:hypothetical protein